MNNFPAALAQILIHRPPVEVFEAFVDPMVMSQFWFTRRDVGLQEGASVAWFVGDQPKAAQFKVHVKRLRKPDLLVIEWGEEELFTSVTWTFAEHGPSSTLLRIEESGFVGDADAVLSAAFDSTRGFNQVAVAVKALLEHAAIINVVADHA